MSLAVASAKRYARKSAFLEFYEKDGLSVIAGYGVDDLKPVPLKRWERLSGPAAYCRWSSAGAPLSPGKPDNNH